MLGLWALWCVCAHANDDVADEVAPHPEERARWGGLVMPLFGASSTDGVGLGLGGEVFRRRPGQSDGYHLKFTTQLYANLRLDYTNDYVRVEVLDRTSWLLSAGYLAWANLLYAGVGGQDVAYWGGDSEAGNAQGGPTMSVLASRDVLDDHTSLFVQVYGRAVRVTPGAEGLLSERMPLGATGAGYADVTAGLYRRAVDRWPMPRRGATLEASVRVGGTVADGRTHPLGGVLVEAIGWRGVWNDRLVFGGRALFDHTVGSRPFFEQDRVGGRFRDELGSEQALAGYGRVRTRGDGVLAGMIEVRPSLLSVDKGFFDLAFHASLVAEQGWLFERGRPGPPMPTLGVGLPVLFQKAIVLRPFVAWGWMREDPDMARTPRMQFGISLMDPL